VVGDRFGGEWPRERFRLHGINYDFADMAKTDLYQVLLPLINSRAVDLLDHDRLVHQMVGLEQLLGNPSLQCEMVEKPQLITIFQAC
jgi:hypothetical protein